MNARLRTPHSERAVSNHSNSPLHGVPMMGSTWLPGGRLFHSAFSMPEAVETVFSSPRNFPRRQFPILGKTEIGNAHV